MALACAGFERWKVIACSQRTGSHGWIDGMDGRQPWLLGFALVGLMVVTFPMFLHGPARMIHDGRTRRV